MWSNENKIEPKPRTKMVRDEFPGKPESFFCIVDINMSIPPILAL